MQTTSLSTKTKYCGCSPGNNTNLGAGLSGGLLATSVGSSVCCRNEVKEIANSDFLNVNVVFSQLVHM